MNTVQKTGKLFVWSFLVLFLIGLCVLIGVTGLSLVEEVLSGNIAGALFLCVGMAAFLGILLFAAWLLDSAPRAARELKRARYRQPGPDGDLSGVAGVMQREPWLG